MEDRGGVHLRIDFHLWEGLGGVYKRRKWLAIHDSYNFPLLGPLYQCKRKVIYTYV